MIRFTQPSDSIHKGRVIWVRPEEVMVIERADRCHQCCITLRNGDVFFLAVEGEVAARHINRALKEGK